MFREIWTASETETTPLLSDATKRDDPGLTYSEYPYSSEQAIGDHQLIVWPQTNAALSDEDEEIKTRGTDNGEPRDVWTTLSVPLIGVFVSQADTSPAGSGHVREDIVRV